MEEISMKRLILLAVAIGLENNETRYFELKKVSKKHRSTC